METATTVTVELTESEKRMIELNREKMRLAEEEKKVKLIADKEKAIKQKEEAVAKIIAEANMKVDKAYEFYEKFDHELYSLVLGESNCRAIVEDPSWTKDENGRYIICWEKQYQIPTVEIKRAGYNITIRINEHTTHSGRWSTTSHGYKMQIHGLGYEQENRYLSNVKTVQEKIETFIKNYEEKAEAKRKKDNLLASISFSDTRLKEYVESENATTLYHGGYRGRVWDKYMNSYNGWVVNFKNGVKVELAPKQNGDEYEWSIVGITYPRPETPKGDFDDVMAQLAGAPTFDELSASIGINKK